MNIAWWHRFSARTGQDDPDDGSEEVAASLEEPADGKVASAARAEPGYSALLVPGALRLAVPLS
jgi:hypothetical protein